MVSPAEVPLMVVVQLRLEQLHDEDVVHFPNPPQVVSTGPPLPSG